MREALSGCVDCAIGKANLAGQPMPLTTAHTRETTTMTATDQKWKDRACARDKSVMFTPSTGLQKVCGVCDACKAAQAKGAGKPKPAAKPKPASAPAVSSSPTAPAVLHLRSAREMLEQVGYKVTELSTPNGPRLLVGAA